MAISLCLVAVPAHAVEWLGTVKVKSLRVHKGRDASSPVIKTLSNGTKVVVESNRRGRTGKSWCGIRQQARGETLGYVDCDGMTHTMTQNWFEDFASSRTSASGVSAPIASTQQATASNNMSSRNQAQAPAQATATRKATVKVNGKDMTDRYKGKSAVMYMTPT
ncbi:MAG: hypothetical protein KAR83_08450 [Thermodesulfovibrionales bacterium]|nr:hypothetical protein [Thermodesulfovibrionales bacterium]